MATRDEVLRFILQTQGQEGLDALAKSMASAGKEGHDSGEEVKKLAAELGLLIDKTKQVEALTGLQQQLSKVDAELASAKAKLEQLNATYGQTGPRTAAVTKEFQTAEQIVASLGDKHDRLAVRVAQAGAALEKSGVDTSNLGKAHEELGAKATATAAHLATAAASAERGGISFATLKEHALGVGEYLKSGGERALEFGKRLLEISGIAGIVTSALAAFTGFRFFEAGIEDAQALGGALKKLSAISGATGEDLHHLKEIAEEAAHATSTSAVESVQALTQLTKSFGDVHKAAEVLPTALQFAKAAGIELSQSVEIVATTMKAFNVSADQASHVTDALATVSRKTGADLGALSDSFGKLAPYASQAHISFDQTAAALGALAQRGLTAEQSSRALIAVFGALDDPSSKLKQSLVGLGITTNDFGGILDGLKAAGSRGVEALEGLDKRAKPALLALVQAGGADLRDLSAAIEQSTGETRRLSDFMTSGFGAAVKNFKTHIDEIAGETVSGVFAPLNAEIRKLDAELLEASKSGALEKIKEAITELVKIGVDQFDKLVHAINWEDFGKTITEFAKSAAEAMKGLKESVTGTAGAMRNFASDVTTSFNGARIALDYVGLAIKSTMFYIFDGLEKAAEGLSLFRADAAAAAEKYREIKDQYAKDYKELSDEIDSDSEKVKAALKAQEDQIKATGDAAKDATPKHEEHAKAIKQVGDAATSAEPYLDNFEEYLRKSATSAEAAAVSQTTLADKLAAAKKELLDSLDAYEKLRATVGTTAEQLAVAKQRTADAAAAYSALEKATGSLALETSQNAVPSLDSLIKKFREVPPDAEAVKTAFKSLGVTSQDSLEKIAEDARTNFAIVEATSKQTASGLADRQAAFLDYAKKELAAAQNAGEGERARAQAMLESKAAALGLTNTIAGLIEASNKSSIAANESAKTQLLGVQQAAEGARLWAQESAAAAARTAEFDAAMRTLADSTATAAEKEKALAVAADTASSAMERQAVAAEDASARMGQVSNTAHGVAEAMAGAQAQFNGVSEAAGHEFAQAMDHALSSIGLVKVGTTDLTKSMNDLTAAAADTGGFLTYFRALASVQAQTQAKIDGQRESLASSIGLLNTYGTAAQQNFGVAGQGADKLLASLEAQRNALQQGNSGFDLLGQQELGPLQQALDAAIARTQQLAAAAQAAEQKYDSLAQSIHDALLQEQGNQSALEDERHQKQLADLAAAAKEANSLNSDSYQKAVQEENQLHDLKMKNLQKQAQAAANASKSSGGGTSTSAGGGASSSVNSTASSSSGSSSSAGGGTASSGTVVHLNSTLQVSLQGSDKSLSNMTQQDMQALAQKLIPELMPTLMQEFVYQLQLAKKRS